MIDSMGDGIGVRADGCWRLMTIQTRGCMTTAVHLCDDRRREQQRQLATYVGVNDGDVVGFGDTRLGEDTSGMEALMRRELSRQQSGQKLEGDRREGTVRTRVSRREEGV